MPIASRTVVTILTALVLVGAAPSPADACSKRHQPVFELFDLARDVAVVKVGAVPLKRAAGPVGLTIKQRLKGTARRLVARETNSSCAAGFRSGRTALVFLAADRWPVGAYEGYLEKPDPALVGILQAWGAAATDADRAAVLVASIDGALPRLRGDAAMYLLDRPALIAALTAAQTKTLVVASARGDHQDELVQAILARQHGQAWRDLLAAAPRKLPAGADALAAHDFEAVTDVGQLADTIVTTPGESAPARIAALERCERVRGVLLEEFSMYRHGRADRWWLKLAEACRTGVAPHW